MAWVVVLAGSFVPHIEADYYSFVTKQDDPLLRVVLALLPGAGMLSAILLRWVLARPSGTAADTAELVGNALRSHQADRFILWCGTSASYFLAALLVSHDPAMRTMTYAAGVLAAGLLVVTAPTRTSAEAVVARWMKEMPIVLDKLATNVADSETAPGGFENPNNELHGLGSGWKLVIRLWRTPSAVIIPLVSIGFDMAYRELPEVMPLDEEHQRKLFSPVRGLFAFMCVGLASLAALPALVVRHPEKVGLSPEFRVPTLAIQILLAVAAVLLLGGICSAKYVSLIHRSDKTLSAVTKKRAIVATAQYLMRHQFLWASCAGWLLVGAALTLWQREPHHAILSAVVAAVFLWATRPRIERLRDYLLY